MDRLASLFEHFTLSARVFYSGRLCGISGDHATEDAGHLHLLRRGVLRVLQPGYSPIAIDEPSVLFYARPLRHVLRPTRRAAPSWSARKSSSAPGCAILWCSLFPSC